MATSNKDNIHFIEGTVANGDYTVDGSGGGFTMAELSYIHFFDSGGNKVTPTAGTITVTMSPDGELFRSVDNGVFNAVDVNDAARIPPSGVGLVRAARITLAGITGATRFIACVWRG